MLTQTLALSGINLKSIGSRIGSSLVIVVGLAGVVAVFTALLAMSEGFSSTLQASGRQDAALVLRGGSNAELNSGMSRDEIALIKHGTGVKLDADGQPMASGELIVIAELYRKGEKKNGANVTLRGIEQAGFSLRPNLRITEGRTFGSGLRELIVGRGVTKQFDGAGLGQTIRLRGSDWTVVGIFDSGDAYESELWGDAEVVQSAFTRRGYSSVLAVLESASGLTAFKDSLTSDPRLTVDVISQQDYFSAQSKGFRRTIGFLAVFITVIMGMGAIFAALNTMYAAVATRSREIATLRALGFGGLPVVASVMIESLLLALVGGAIGAVIAYVLFNNVSISTLSANFTQVVFSFKVTPQLVLVGLAISLVIGMIGGFLPALRAARMPITTALRAL